MHKVFPRQATVVQAAGVLQALAPVAEKPRGFPLVMRHGVCQPDGRHKCDGFAVGAGYDTPSCAGAHGRFVPCQWSGDARCPMRAWGGRANVLRFFSLKCPGRYQRTSTERRGRAFTTVSVSHVARCRGDRYDITLILRPRAPGDRLAAGAAPGLRGYAGDSGRGAATPGRGWRHRGAGVIALVEDALVEDHADWGGPRSMPSTSSAPSGMLQPFPCCSAAST